MRKVMLLALTAGAVLGGCGAVPTEYTTDERKANGLVVILPGIEGESPANHEIREGLDSAGINWAMPIYPWGRPVPVAGVLLNQMDFLGNRLSAIGVARMIIEYENQYPGRPVYVVGHSGGGGVSVFTAEAIADIDPNYKVDGLVLLSASISNGYDLTKALRQCRRGIVNFYNPSDTGLLAVGTTVAGNVDGGHGPSAGLEGFQKEFSHLHQVQVDDGGDDPHFAATRMGFVSGSVAPWILSSGWPPGADHAESPDADAKTVAHGRGE